MILKLMTIVRTFIRMLIAKRIQNKNQQFLFIHVGYSLIDTTAFKRRFQKNIIFKYYYNFLIYILKYKSNLIYVK